MTRAVDGSNYSSGEVYANWQATGYRLPTEGEWEFLARAGAGGPFTAPEAGYYQITNGSCEAGAMKTLEGLAWFCANRGGGTHDVGSKGANAWNLMDVQGNVCEWVWDLFGNYPASKTTDYRGVSTGDGRVKRGGSWSNFPRNVRLAARASQAPGMRCNDLGFRLVR